MDHIEVLREKIGRLRVEIAQIQELNKQYRLRDSNDAEAQTAHGQRQERLQAIQQELVQLASLGRKVQSVEEMKETQRSRSIWSRRLRRPIRPSPASDPARL
jgi:hypothetical protein